MIKDSAQKNKMKFSKGFKVSFMQIFLVTDISNKQKWFCLFILIGNYIFPERKS